MLQHERINYIVAILEKKGTVTTTEIEQSLLITKQTIRSDFNKICVTYPNIERIHGGLKINNADTKKITSYDLRKKTNVIKKNEIAKKAIQFIEQKDTIIMDSSSTCYQLAELLYTSDIKCTVITTGMHLASMLKENPNLTVMLLSGILTPSSNSIDFSRFIHPYIEGIISEFNIEKIFFSASGVSVKYGFSDYNYSEVAAKKFLLSLDLLSIALIDSSKFEQNSTSSFSTIGNVDYLITNNLIDEEIISKYSKIISII